MTRAIDKYRVNPSSLDLTLQIIRDRINLGNKLQELEEEELTKDQLLEYNDAIILTPDYQREYRSTSKDESSLIESMLLGIPIPPIFLASHKLKGVQVLNVVDGQHRLRAFYRFFENKFNLKELTILTDYNNLYFRDLEIDDLRMLQSGNILAITFRQFPGKEFELEIFSRYNKGTKPLTPQEIRHAVYDSRTNQRINVFCKKLLDENDSKLSNAYSVSKTRYQKKALQENIFVILYILEHGINTKIQKSPLYAENYMKEKSELAKDFPDRIDADFDNTEYLFSEFNQFIERLSSFIDFPFSREIYGFSRQKSKFQISIAMIVAGIFNKMKKSNMTIDTICSTDKIEYFLEQTNDILSESHLENPEYKASSTNPIELKQIVDLYKIPK
jgi:hypothetical protein